MICFNLVKYFSLKHLKECDFALDGAVTTISIGELMAIEKNGCTYQEPEWFLVAVIFVVVLPDFWWQ